MHLRNSAPASTPGGSFGTGVSTTRGALVAAATNNFSANGGVGGNNEILIDGISVTLCCQGQPALTPSAEVVDQFKVITSNPARSLDAPPVASSTSSLKPAPIASNGPLYDFLRNDKLDAANFFTKRSGVYPIAGRKDFAFPASLQPVRRLRKWSGLHPEESTTARTRPSSPSAMKASAT